MASNLLQTVANFETTITAKLTTAGASLTLTANTDKDGNSLPAGKYGFTLNEGKANEEHVIGDLSGSTVSNLIRNVSRINGTTAGTGKEHRKGSSIKITNHPILVRIVRLLDGLDAFNGTSPMRYDAAPTFTPGSNQLVTVAYADGLVAGGVADATVSTKGKSRMSVAPSSPTDPVSIGVNNTTSGTAAGAGNGVVDAADVAENTASKVVRRKSDSNVTVPASPTATTDAASKNYVDAQGEYIPALAMGIANAATKTRGGSATAITDVVRMDASNSSIAYAQTRVPFGKTSLSSIKILYCPTVGGNNVILNATVVEKLPVSGAAATTDNDGGNNTLAVGATANRLYEYTIPSARYSSISSVAAGDLISLYLERDGGNASDTNTGNFDIAGILFTFA